MTETNTKTNRWFKASVKSDKNAPYVYVKKNDDKTVIIWNGRYSINFVSKEEAKLKYVLESIVPEKSQEETEREFFWYLNY